MLELISDFVALVQSIFSWIAQYLSFFMAVAAVGAFLSAFYSKKGLDQARRPLLKLDVACYGYQSTTPSIIVDHNRQAVYPRDTKFRIKNLSDNPAIDIKIKMLYKDRFPFAPDRFRRSYAMTYKIKTVYPGEESRFDLNSDLLTNILLTRKLVEPVEKDETTYILPTKDLEFTLKFSGSYKSDTKQFYQLPSTEYLVRWRKGDEMMEIKSDNLSQWSMEQFTEMPSFFDNIVGRLTRRKLTTKF